MLSAAHSAVRRVLLAPIRFYQRAISPLKPPTCRYVPSCSQYAIDAIEHRGMIRGSLLALWRLLRCNPLFTGGHDPVVPKALPDSCTSYNEAHEQRGCS